MGSVDAHSSCGGAPGGHLGETGEAGAGGNGSDLLCADTGSVTGGEGGLDTGAGGRHGLGGFGGVTRLGESPARWLGSSTSSWKAGRGGDSSGDGGSGGGGLGGGGGGGSLLNHEFGGAGAGGGGSWTRITTLPKTDGLLQGNSPSDQGAVVLSFDICAIDPASPFCSAGFVRVDENVEISRRGRRGAVNVLLKGSAEFDVSQLDTSRIGFGSGVVPPQKAPRRARDLDGDGFADLKLRFSPASLQLPGKGDSVHCLYMAQLDGAPLIGCARLQTLQRARKAKSDRRKPRER